MGRRGTKPKPTMLKLLHGDHKKNPQRINRDEPIPADGKPRMPTGFCEHEKTRWKFMCQQLEEMHLQTPANLPLLEAYVRTWNHWRIAEEKVREQGAVESTTSGSSKPNAWWTVARDCLTACNRMLAELGFTPAARASMHVVKSDKTQQVMRRQRG